MRWRGLYAIVDPEHCGGRDPIGISRDILSARPALLQLRMKSGSDREKLELADALASLCRRADVPFVVNDRPDIARMVGADGVHLGQDDLPPAAARKFAPGLIVGVSTHTLDQAERAAHDGADLIGFGPVYETSSKQNPDAVVGPMTLAQVCQTVPVPVVAIGGITVDRARAAIQAGASLVASISALTLAADPHAAAEAFNLALAAVPRQPGTER